MTIYEYYDVNVTGRLTHLETKAILPPLREDLPPLRFSQADRILVVAHPEL